VGSSPYDSRPCFWEYCERRWQGIEIFISFAASTNMRIAADALFKGLTEALVPPRNNAPSVIGPHDNTWFSHLTEDDPEKVAGLNPDEIVILIGIHPQ
jgi:hypothetical protein